MTTKKMPKNAEIFICEICNFKCKQNSDMIRHLSTAKHKRKFEEKDFTVESKNYGASKMQSCVCNKRFKTISGLWKHQKKCEFNKDSKNAIIDDNTKSNNGTLSNYELTNIVLDIVKSNQELQKQMIEVCKNIQPNVSNTINQNNINQTNSNNKTFNLQFFLNETCKDAININDFIKNIEIQLKEIENIGNNGYVSGITDIIVSRLKQLDVTKRPVHCTDLKRETLYIKDEDTWNKDTNDNTKKTKRKLFLKK